MLNAFGEAMSSQVTVEEIPLFPLVAVPEITTVCMYCQRQKHGPEQWEAATEKVLPGSSHGVCPDCYWGALNQIWCDMREADKEQANRY